MNAKIKACPFCGSIANVWTKEGRSYGRNHLFAIVQCTMCNASSGAVTSYLEADEEGFTESVTFDTVVKKWNTRTEDKSKRCETCIDYNPDYRECWRKIERGIAIEMEECDFCSYWHPFRNT